MGIVFVIPESAFFCVAYCYYIIKPVSLDSDSRSVNSASFHTVSYMPEISHKDSDTAALLERIACTACSSYWTEQLGNNCGIYRSPVLHEAPSKSVVSQRYSSQHFGLYNT